jgi:hypothetical protein
MQVKLKVVNEVVVLLPGFQKGRDIMSLPEIDWL